jgi:hypothetical protein
LCRDHRCTPGDRTLDGHRTGGVRGCPAGPSRTRKRTPAVEGTRQRAMSPPRGKAARGFLKIGAPAKNPRWRGAAGG